MARAVWKFPINPDRSTVTMPRGARLLAAGEQLGALFIWADVDPDAPTVEQPVRVALTGEPIGDRWQHVDTVQLSTGFVVHVFDPTYRMKGL